MAIRRFRHAGLETLFRAGRTSGIRPEHAERLSEEEMIPAPGQGALAVQSRAEGEARETVNRIDDPASHAAFDAERELVSRLGGGCALPLGAYARPRLSGLQLHAVVFRPDGSNFLQSSVSGTDAEDVAARAATHLLEQGARDVLEDLR